MDTVKTYKKGTFKKIVFEKILCPGTTFKKKIKIKQQQLMVEEVGKISMF